MSELEWTGERLVTSLEGDSFIFEHLHRYAIAQKISAGKTVLDIACGEGYGSHLISKTAAYVYGVDIDENSVIHAQKKYGPLKNNLSYKVGSTSKIPLEDKSIDIVVSFETIEHHDEHEQMMLEIKRVLKPAGMLIISSPNKPVYNRAVPNNIYHVKELAFGDFKILIDKHFSCAAFYEQRFVAGSLITPLMHASSSFETYDGNFENITETLEEQSMYNQHYYSMAICTNAEAGLPGISSFFNGVKAVLKQHEHFYNKGKKYVTASNSFKIGNWFVSKVAFLKRLKKK